MMSIICRFPVVVDSMRTWDRFKPQKRLEPRPEALQKPQISRTVRGVRPAKETPVKRHLHVRCYQQQSPAKSVVIF